ncbi:IS5/IS1182 family transposase, partial [Xanthomonas oryzae pv. oryzae]
MAHTQNADFFRQPLAEMIDPRHPLAVLARRLPRAQIEAVLAPHFARKVRAGRAVARWRGGAVAQHDLFGPSVQVAGAGIAAAGRP